MNKDNVIQKKYHHISKDERDIIAIRLGQEKSDSGIARELNRHRSTIWREKKQNMPKIRDVQYLAHRAQERANIRWKESHKRERIANKRLQAHVITRIKKEYSPEQVAGRLVLEKPELKTNHETIYQFIYNDARHLIKYLRKSHRIRRKRGSAKNKRSVKVQNRTMIDQRPEAANLRKQYGHWETDTMVSRASKAALQATYERKTMLVRLQKLDAKTAENMRKGLTMGMCKFPKNFLRTITFDNGTENAEHEKIAEALDIDVYFCNPYHSWEKGGVENIIGLIRQYLPKGTDIAKLSKAEIKKIERRLNNRPRKRLGYRTPAEVAKKVVALAA